MELERNNEYERQLQQILRMEELQERVAQEENQQRYIELLHNVETFLEQLQQENDEFLDFYRHGRDIIVAHQQQNTQLPHDTNQILLQMINEMNIEGIIRRYKNYGITHICFLRAKFGEVYAFLAFRKIQGNILTN